MMKVDFYFWGDQCPYSSLLREQLGSLAETGDFAVNFFDISSDYQLAGDLNIYSPNLLIFNDEHRWNGPLTKEHIKTLKQGGIPDRDPYRVEIGDNIIIGSLRGLTEETALDTQKPCAPQHDRGCCAAKAGWIKYYRERYDLPYLGLLHYLEGECVGGAEFIPSAGVPYPITRDNSTAFLTCVYPSAEEADYKHFPLQKLEDKLPDLGYEKLIAVASEEVVFPNGPLEWFIERGYEDLGEVFYEENDQARMHLVKKKLLTCQ